MKNIYKVIMKKEVFFGICDRLTNCTYMYMLRRELKYTHME